MCPTRTLGKISMHVQVLSYYMKVKPMHLLCMTYSEGEGLRAVEDVLKPPGSLLATDRSKAVVLV